MGTINKGMMTSSKDEYETPPDLFWYYDWIYRFAIDAAASDLNAKAEKYFTKEDDGLSQDWTETTWVNPPYGIEVKHWVKKAYNEAARHNVDVVMLLAARTDTKWFHDYVMKANEVVLIKGRLKFVGEPYPAPFPSMVVVFNGSFYTARPQFYSLDYKALQREYKKQIRA